MAPKPLEVLRFVARSSKRIAVSVIGGALVLAGIAMIVLPGPGILVVALGFAVLGTEYAWAAAALERTKRTAGEAGRFARGPGAVLTSADQSLEAVTRRVARSSPAATLGTMAMMRLICSASAS